MGDLGIEQERRSFIAISAIIFLYVVLRACLVPVTHDEALTFFTYVETGDFLPFHAHWDAGNHLLCTALAWCSYRCFGLHLCALRAPSVLAFLLYAMYAWRWGRMLKSGTVRWCLWSALLLVPFMLEFFALFRGYALAMAFLSMGLFHFTLFVHHGGRAHFLGTLCAWCCASYAALTLVPLWFLVLVIVIFMMLRHEPRITGRIHGALVIVALGIVPWSFAYTYATGLNDRGLLYYGNDLGFLQGSIGSLLLALFGRRDAWAPLLVVVLLAGLLIIALRELRSSPTMTRTALLILCALLIADVGLRAGLRLHFHTPYPEDRTLLQWLLLFVLASAIAIDRLTIARPGWRFAACALLIFPLRTLIIANVSVTSYWPEEAVPASVFEAAATTGRKLGRPATIGAYHQMPGCWAFGMRQRGLMLNAVAVGGFPQNDCDLLLVDPQRDAPLPDNYHLLLQLPSSHQLLLERNAPLRTHVVLDTLIEHLNSRDEFTELWRPPMTAMRSHRYLVQVDLSITSAEVPLAVDLVSEVAAAGDKQHYEDLPLQFMRGRWNGDTLSTVRNIPRVHGDADHVVVYLWDRGHSIYSARGRLRILQVDEP